MSANKDFQKWNKPLPTHDEHGTIEDIFEKAERLLPNSWWLEGNILKGHTKLGLIAQTIPTNYILVGTDKDGMPNFKNLDN